MPHTETEMLDKGMRDCIAACSSCHDICTEAVRHCLILGGEHAAASRINTLLDCAGICHTSADMMLHGSIHVPSTCRLCAEVCRDCESECRRAGDDPMMRKCADACGACAESCEQMAGTGH